MPPVEDRWSQHIGPVEGAQSCQCNRVQGVGGIQGVEVDVVVVDIVVDVIVDVAVVRVETEGLDHRTTCKLPRAPGTPSQSEENYRFVIGAKKS